MKRCPITNEEIDDSRDYSLRGLKMLSPQLKSLQRLSMTAVEQRREAIHRIGKMSIQGVQTKLSAALRVSAGFFEIVDRNGHYILKTQSEHYTELPENESLTMTLAKYIEIDVPLHGLVYAIDNSMTYFIKRFDRTGHKDRVAVEDFAQLTSRTRETKYDSSMEQVVQVIKTFCTYPVIELAKLYRLTLFNFLIGNEDMHLKNFSLITRNNVTTLSPAYDLVNSSIILSPAREELALPLNGKKNNIKKSDLLIYFPIERMQLQPVVVSDIIAQIKDAVPAWMLLIENSFLSQGMKEQYQLLLLSRLKRLDMA